MTEAEWLACRSPTQLLDACLPDLSVRQQRPVAVAACRTLPAAVLALPEVEHWLATANRLAERSGVILPPAGARKWGQDLWRAVSSLNHNATSALFQLARGNVWWVVVNAGIVNGTAVAGHHVVDEALADIVRDVAGFLGRLARSRRRRRSWRGRGGRSGREDQGAGRARDPGVGLVW
jgi:hypothetical protein